MQDYTSIRVTKEVHQQLQGYADSCYDGLSLTAVLGQLLADLGEGHVRFPEYGLFQCPAHRREQLRAAVGALTRASRRTQWVRWRYHAMHCGVLRRNAPC